MKNSFRFIPFGGQERRRIIGKEGLESRLIGTVAKCNVCKPSESWLGRYSPVPEIKNGKLWLSQYITSGMGLTEQDKQNIDYILTNKILGADH